MKPSTQIRAVENVIQQNRRSHLRYYCSVKALTLAVFAQSIWFAPHANAEDADLEALKAQIDALADMVEAQAEEIDRLKQQIQPAQQDPDTLIQVSPSAMTNSTQSGGFVDTGIDAGRYEVGRVPDDAIVTAGDFEGSISLPGSTASMRIGGYIQADMGYDFDSLGFSDSLNLRTIPLDGSSSDGREVFRSHARYTRLNFDVRDQTAWGEFRSFLELDFFGSGNDTTNNYTPVLRHAAAGVGGFYVGQYWSQFVDVAASPEGPNNPFAVPIVRNPGIRWRTDLNESWRVALGIEDPAGDLTGDSAQLASDSMPNVTGYVQYTQPWGRIRLAGLGLQLESTTDSVYTGGVNLSGRINLPVFGDKDNLAFAAQAGEGFAHYYATLANVGLEGVVAADGSVEATGILAGHLSYQHWWSDALRSTFKISAVEFDSPDGSSETATDGGSSVAFNLFWTPVKNGTFGIEYVYADREVVNGLTGEGSRLSAQARFDF
ncbi:MAG: DcaP family trimeric outer membrane transporter [Pseudomonadota bacterium]